MSRFTRKGPKAIVVATMVCALLESSPTLPAQVVAPSWRNSPGSTFQEWTFPTNDTTIIPDSSSNLFGTAVASLSQGALASPWFYTDPVFGNVTGFWDIGVTGRFDISIPDYGGITTNGIKEIRVQYVYYVEAGLFSTALVDVTSASVVSMTLSNRLFMSTEFGEWRVDDWSFIVDDGSEPDLITILNPNFNRTTLIDWIVIDTLAVPEPMPLVACAVAGVIALLAGRRLRRR